MSGFYQIIESLEGSRPQSRIADCTTGQVEALLDHIQSGGQAGPEEMARLVSPAASELLEPMAQLARAITARRFGKTIQMYAPLYISNHCTNSCLYCGFNVHNQIVRRTSGREEILAEARLLKGQHLGQLLLVSGECPSQVGVDLLEGIASDLKGMFPSLAIEVYPLDQEGYIRLFRAGIDSLTIYQETYDRKLYARVHPAGPKADFRNRLEAPERGAAAGFRQVGIGALLGLTDWRTESVYLAHHVAYLSRQHWRSQVAVSFPRLRPAAGGYQPEFPVSDRELVQMICAFRLLFPDASLVLSTREPAQLRDNLVGLGITKMSAGSKTSPGGYLDEHGAEGQFDVFDGRSVEEVAGMIRARGCDPVWKDWDRGFEG